MKASYFVSGLTYLPRQDGSSNGNIGQHTIALSADGLTFSTPVAIGTYWDEKRSKTTLFTPRSARYVRLIALTEAGGRGPWTSAAEITLAYSTTYTPPTLGQGSWDLTIDFPTVPVAAFVVPQNGKVLVFSSFEPHNFGGGTGRTVTAVYDPATKLVTGRVVANTQHDMYVQIISQISDLTT